MSLLLQTARTCAVDFTIGSRLSMPHARLEVLWISTSSVPLRQGTGGGEGRAAASLPRYLSSASVSSDVRADTPPGRGAA